MSPGDLILYRDKKFGCHRIWEVQGVHLGGLGVEGLIAIKSLTEKPGWAEGRAIETTYVPECLLRNVEVYTAAEPQAKGERDE
jgi:hypothetical protein